MFVVGSTSPYFKLKPEGVTPIYIKKRSRNKGSNDKDDDDWWNVGWLLSGYWELNFVELAEILKLENLYLPSSRLRKYELRHR